VTSDVEELAAAIAAGSAASTDSGAPEAVLREYVQPILAKSLSERGVRSKARDEVSMSVPAIDEAAVLDAPLTSVGRADAIYNRFVVEFEPPGSLRPSLMHSATRHAYEQVQQYLRGVSEEAGVALERLAGCAFDGTWIVYVRGEPDGWRVSRPQRVDLRVLEALLDTLESLASGRGLSAANLDEDFGRKSESARKVVSGLVQLFVKDEASDSAQAMFAQWNLDLGNASGPFAPSDARDWTELCKDLGVPDTEDLARQVLFCAQTYYAIVSKLVAVIILEGANRAPLLQELLKETDAWKGFEDLESGRLTRATGADNVVEPGIFSWYLDERSHSLEEALASMAGIAGEYSAEIVEITPLVARDVLKDLYQRLLPRSIRHRLGEYYTPDWLAQRTVDRATEGHGELRLGTRVLDPASGSGTFLVEAISRILANSSGRPAEEVLRAVVNNVVGFDLSPLAVQASKVNYLLALGPLLRHIDPENPITIPVYLADSVSPPQVGDILQGNVYVLRTGEGDWRIPTAAATQDGLSRLGKLFEEALREEDTAPAVRERAKTRLIEISTDEEALDHVAHLYEKLRGLTGGLSAQSWWKLVQNAFAPTFHSDFDYVIGNPPWVSWETLPASYRRANDRQWDLFELRPAPADGRRQRSANVRLDLSMLFVARSMAEYVASSGRLGFLVTATIFKSELAGRGFRQRKLPEGGRYSFDALEDLSDLRVFDEAANVTALLTASHGDAEGRQVPLQVWRGIEGKTIPTHLGLEQVLDRTAREDWAAESVDPRDPASPLLTMPRGALAASLPMRHPSPFLEFIREGINTRGANGIFFVEILASDGEKVKIRNLPHLGRDRSLEQKAGFVEKGSIKRLIRGGDVTHAGVNATLGVIFFHDQDHVSFPMSDSTARQRFPLAHSFMSSFRERLQMRRPFRNFDPSGTNWLGLYSVTAAALAEDKVVVREIAGGMIAAPVHNAGLVPDHKLHVIQCSTPAEADDLATALQSPIVDRLIRGFALPTSMNGSFLRYIGIRSLRDEDPPDGMSRIAASLGLTSEQYDELLALG
jgi:hypothetical protein